MSRSPTRRSATTPASTARPPWPFPGRAACTLDVLTDWQARRSRAILQLTVHLLDQESNVAADHPNVHFLERLARSVGGCHGSCHGIAWSALGAVFEGIRGYWNPDQEQLHVFRLTEHLDRLQDSTPPRSPAAAGQHSASCPTSIANCCAQNECREDTYIFPLVFGADAESKRFDPNALESELTHPDRANAEPPGATDYATARPGQHLDAHFGHGDAAACEEHLQLPQRPACHARSAPGRLRCGLHAQSAGQDQRSPRRLHRLR